MLQLCQINKSYPKDTQPDQQVLDDVSLLAIPGDFVGIWGPPGAGKTTLLSIIADLIPADSGKIEFENLTLSCRSSFRTRQTVTLLNPSINLSTHMTVRQYLLIACAPLKSTECHDIIQRRLHQLILECRLEHLLDKFLDQLNPEQIQFTALTHCLLSCPLVLLADEPTAGLLHDERLLRRLGEYAQCGGIVVIATETPQALRYRTRLFSLRNGKLRSTNQQTKFDSMQALVS